MSDQTTFCTKHRRCETFEVAGIADTFEVYHVERVTGLRRPTGRKADRLNVTMACGRTKQIVSAR